MKILKFEDYINESLFSKTLKRKKDDLRKEDSPNNRYYKQDVYFTEDDLEQLIDEEVENIVCENDIYYTLSKDIRIHTIFKSIKCKNLYLTLDKDIHTILYFDENIICDNIIVYCKSKNKLGVSYFTAKDRVIILSNNDISLYNITFNCKDIVVVDDILLHNIKQHTPEKWSIKISTYGDKLAPLYITNTSTLQNKKSKNDDIIRLIPVHGGTDFVTDFELDDSYDTDTQDLFKDLNHKFISDFINNKL